MEEKPEPAPTHLLRDGVATPLRAEVVVLEADLELFNNDGRWLLRGTIPDGLRVNGSVYRNEAALKSGDTITSTAGVTFVLIEVQA